MVSPECWSYPIAKRCRRTYIIIYRSTTIVTRGFATMGRVPRCSNIISMICISVQWYMPHWRNSPFWANPGRTVEAHPRQKTSTPPDAGEWSMGSGLGPLGESNSNKVWPVPSVVLRHVDKRRVVPVLGSNFPKLFQHHPHQV